MTKYQALLQEYGEALERFQEVLQQEKTEFIRDSAIKRFEIVFDLAWKTLKAFLETQGIPCVSPKTCFREAHRAGLIEYDEIWMKLVDERNYTAHTYKEAFAENIYQKLPQALAAFQKLRAALAKDAHNV
ncbi:HI0074 family nucleotidyltransferase substrate-binding subunit [Patescibacteria group bacterium]|nr:HI0074 family nucleotidyltransferase substrate-binding subunit [Patescibacteria group bacterium]